MAETFEVTLHNGTKAMVTRRQAAVIKALHDLEIEVAGGVVACLGLVRVKIGDDDGEGMWMYDVPEKLPQLNEGLHLIGTQALEAAAKWQGNAPQANRSRRRQ